MSKYPSLQPQQECAAACGTWASGPFEKGPKHITTIFYFAYSQNPCL